MKCIKCKNELADNVLFCTKCGASQEQNTQPVYPENEEGFSVQPENKSTPENSNVSLNKTEVGSTYSIQDNIQNSAANTENISLSNAPKKSATDNSKLIIIIAAVAMVLIMIITAGIKIGLKSSDEPSTTKSNTTMTQRNKETTERDKETTESRDMVSLISICPTYEEFMDKLTSSEISNLSTQKVTDNHINTTFDYSGVVVTILYSNDEPHNINSVTIGSITSSSFNESWFSSAAAVCEELLYLYLDDVANSDSSETMYGKLSDNAKTENASGLVTVSSEYKSKGITYRTTLTTGSYISSYIQSVDIDENYMMEKTE